jgi:Gas vesicle synthesis protein GvpO
MATKKTGTGGRSTAAKKSATTQQSDETSSDDTESTSKTTTAKKSATKKSPAKKSPAKKATKRSGPSERATAPRASAPQRKSGVAVAAGAAQQLLALTGREAEGVTGLERTEDGWRVEVEVVEVRRIPDTTDVLALYEVTLDEDGELEGYRRLRRYGRGSPGQES